MSNFLIKLSGQKAEKNNVISSMYVGRGIIDEKNKLKYQDH